MLRRIRGLQQDDRGFTLIELMVVVIIVAVLAAIAIPLYTGYIKNARSTEATARLGSIMTAAKAYYQRHNVWPDEGDDGFYGDFTITDHFDYEVESGAGGTGAYTLFADGQAADGMGNVEVRMTCASVSAEGVISISGL